MSDNPIRCSTLLCGAPADWVRDNPYVGHGTERKCRTCFFRGGQYRDHHPKWREVTRTEANPRPDVGDENNQPPALP